MVIQLGKSVKTFRPRPSVGRLSLVIMAAIILALGVAPALALGPSSGNAMITLIIVVPVALAFLALAFWFPTMRYELHHDQITLRYGPVLTYRIPLSEIRTIRRRNLSLTIWSTVRFPGIALFTVPYGDMGNVKMCATAALNNILLIETDKEKYGLTPANENQFVDAVRTQMEA